MNLEDKLRERRLELVLGIGGIVLIGFGVLWWKTGEFQGDKIEIISSDEAVATSEGVLVVDVSGAVVSPGVYKFKYGSRIDDAILAAGGIAKEADGEWIQKYLNRSEKMKDGMKVYIPNKQETPQTESRVQGVSAENKVNVNSSSQGELEALPGVGPVTAGKIISGRPYNKTEELLEKKIVGSKLWEEIKDLISVW